MQPAFALFENIDDLSGLFCLPQPPAQFVTSKNAHERADQTKIFGIHRLRNTKHRDEMNRAVRLHYWLSEPAKCHYHFGHRGCSGMTHREAVLEIDLRVCVSL